jgi:hypothetical protein
MRLSIISLAGLVLVVCNAAPVRWELPIEARESLGLFEVRDDGVYELFIREPMEPYPRPGMLHPKESNPPVTAFHPVPQNSYVKTPGKVYSSKDINKAATDMFSNLPNADPYRSKDKNRLKSYPKPSTGFRPTEAGNPAPNPETHVSYHVPIGGPKQYTIGPQGSAKVGADRLVAHRKVTDTAHTIGVSYHDPTKPIPAARPGGLQSNNHPFSMAPELKGGPVKVAAEKFKKSVSNTFKKKT